MRNVAGLSTTEAQKSSDMLMKCQFEITLHDEMRHRTALGKDVRGNITRLDNTIASLPERLENAENKLSELQTQQESAREESRKPFAQEAELREKSARLAELDALLNMDEPDHQVLGEVAEDATYAAVDPANEEKSSVFNDLEKYGSNLSGNVKIHSRQHAEVL